MSQRAPASAVSQAPSAATGRAYACAYAHTRAHTRAHIRAQEYGTAMYSRQLSDVLDGLGLTRPVDLLGYSMGRPPGIQPRLLSAVLEHPPEIKCPPKLGMHK